MTIKELIKSLFDDYGYNVSKIIIVIILCLSANFIVKYITDDKLANAFIIAITLTITSMMNFKK